MELIIKSLTVFKDEKDEDIAVMFHPLNGHPAVHGHELAQYLYYYTTSCKMFHAALNIGRLAAGAVGHFAKDQACLLAPHTKHEPVSFTYVVRQKEGKLIVEVRDNEQRRVIYKGDEGQMLIWAMGLVTYPAAITECLNVLGKFDPSPETGKSVCNLLNRYLGLEDFFVMLPDYKRTGKEQALLVVISDEDDAEARIGEAQMELEWPAGKNIKTIIFWVTHWVSRIAWLEHVHLNSFTSVDRLILKPDGEDAIDLRKDLDRW